MIVALKWAIWICVRTIHFRNHFLYRHARWWSWVFICKSHKSSRKIYCWCSLYAPGCSVNNYIIYTEVVKSLAACFPSYDLALIGDYNLAHITWSMNNHNLNYNTDNSTTRETSDEAIFIRNSFGVLQLEQYHHFLVSGKGYTLDLCFSNFEDVAYERLFQKHYCKGLLGSLIQKQINK